MSKAIAAAVLSIGAIVFVMMPSKSSVDPEAAEISPKIATAGGAGAVKRICAGVPSEVEGFNITVGNPTLVLPHEGDPPVTLSECQEGYTKRGGNLVVECLNGSFRTSGSGSCERKYTSDCQSACTPSAAYPKYTPSAVESEWMPSGTLVKKSCPHFTPEDTKVWNTQSLHPFDGPRSSRIFSCICRSEGKGDAIEPLAGMLRNPEFPCGNNGNRSHDLDVRLAKDWLVVPNVYDIKQSGQLKEGGRVLLYDIGASWFDGGSMIKGWGSSGKWFVAMYAERGIPIDHLYAWEAGPNLEAYVKAYHPDGGMHSVLQKRLTYFHGKVTEDSSDHNAIVVLKRTCRPEDFCILKVDCNSDYFESLYLRAVLEDPVVATLVDESWWDVEDNKEAASADLLLKLRNKGVRAHSWV
eukprot:Sspe_Gene.13482::Locus_4611_Transcript_1_1_Confidence_1.000_Length_1483::g.13482::m.13482